MKSRTAIFVPIVLLGFSYLFLSYTLKPETKYTDVVESVNIEIPVEIKMILDDKCMGCHSSDAKNQKSKMKINFDKFTNGKYSNGKLVSKFGKIIKNVKAGKMPTKKFLSKFPDKKLTAEESKMLIDWATEQKAILAGE